MSPLFKPRSVDELLEKVLELLPGSEIVTDDNGRVGFFTNYAEDEDTGELNEIESLDDDNETLEEVDYDEELS